MNRIDNIAKFAQKKAKEEAVKELERWKQILEYREQIHELKPRIDELIKVGNACLKHNIPLTGSAWGGHEGYDTHQFFTNSWSHLVGFVENRDKSITYLGINAGGACGVYDFRTDGTDTYDVHESTKEIVEPNVHHLKRFLAEFDTFEKEFYEYIDNITK